MLCYVDIDVALCSYVYMWITMWITSILMWITFVAFATLLRTFENIVFSHVFAHHLLLSLVYSYYLLFSLYRNN